MEDISWPQRIWDSFLYNIFGNDKFNIFVYGTFFVAMGVFWTIGSIFSYIDLKGTPKFMMKYKIQENVKTYPLSRETFLDLVKVLLINQSIFLPGLYLGYQFDKWRPIVTIHKLPSVSTAVTHLFISMIIIEILFYYSHRILHYPPLYKRIHKKHHTWTSPVAISAIYCHPIEQLVSNILPVVLGPLILCSHITILWIWITISLSTTLVTHSGYHLPFLPSAEAHDFHHLKFNYNYGVLGLLDRFHGTDGLFKQSKESIRHRTLWTLVSAKQLYP